MCQTLNGTIWNFAIFGKICKNGIKKKTPNHQIWPNFQFGWLLINGTSSLDTNFYHIGIVKCAPKLN